jgi:predicted SnoaL-like aldol condensation-catalyzing enzyme
MTANSSAETGAKTPQIAQRVLRDGEYVVNHSVVAEGGIPVAVRLDLWQIADGRIVAHWGDEEPWALETANGQTQIDGPTEINLTADTESTRKIATDAVQTILVDGDASALDAFLAGEDYVQHNPRFADGVSGLLAALQALAAQGITMKYDQITHVVAEGNFAYVRSEGKFGDEPFVFHDLFRVDAGLCAEHWDVITSRA